MEISQGEQSPVSTRPSTPARGSAPDLAVRGYRPRTPAVRNHPDELKQMCILHHPYQHKVDYCEVEKLKYYMQGGIYCQAASNVSQQSNHGQQEITSLRGHLAKMAGSMVSLIPDSKTKTKSALFWFWSPVSTRPSSLPSLPSDKTWLSPQMNVEKLQKMAGVVRTGGKGSLSRTFLLEGLSRPGEGCMQTKQIWESLWLSILSVGMKSNRDFEAVEH
ncbi:hypothetical protein LXL04_014937 [Taraxacum kok-saghyz]